MRAFLVLSHFDLREYRSMSSASFYSNCEQNRAGSSWRQYGSLLRERRCVTRYPNRYPHDGPEMNSSILRMHSG